MLKAPEESMTKLLEQNNPPNKLSFHREVNSLEFTGIIGKMDIKLCANQEKRDKMLLRMAKKYSKKPKKGNIIIRIEREMEILSQEDIDELLTPVYSKKEKRKIHFKYIKRKIKYLFSWRIRIYKRL
jgi:hypothetical protein